MATFLLFCDEIERSMRKQRVFRDRTMQLDCLSDSELVSRYRMPRHAIFSLLTLVRPMLERPTQRSCPLSPETQVLVTLRYLGKGGFLSEIGDLHGVSESSVSRSFDETITAFCTVLNNIKFPWSREAQLSVKQGFHKLAGFPQVIGAIDGTQIPIKRPGLEEEMAFVCRKGFDSINVQAVCDADLRFSNVVARWPGSTHDSMILLNSGLGRKLEDSHTDGWLLGDSGYACKLWLLTPLLDPQTRPEERYNSSHIKTRNTVERAFGVLKSRFRCLHKSTGCLWFSPDKCVAIIMAAFKLHNYCIDSHVPNLHTIVEHEQDGNDGNTMPTPSKNGHLVRKRLITERFTY